MLRKFFLACVAALLLLPSSGNAAEIKVSTGAMGISSEYRDTSTRAYAMPLINLQTERFFIRGFGAGAYLWKEDTWKLTLGVDYLPVHFRPKDSTNHALRQLDKRYSSMFASASWEYTDKEWGCLRMRLATDILDNSNGVLADIAYARPLHWGDITLTPTVGVLWTSSEYNDYYYGISQEESRRSGLSTYDADSGFSPYASLRVDFALSAHWGLYAIASAMALSNEMSDSPMVDEHVKYGFGGGVSYTF